MRYFPRVGRACLIAVGLIVLAHSAHFDQAAVVGGAFVLAGMWR